VERPLIQLLLIAILLVVASRLIFRGERFLDQFARLLSEPTIQRGRFSFLTGRSYVSGHYEERDVAVRLNLKRYEYETGYLVIALRTSLSTTLGSAAVISRILDSSGRQALDALANHKLFPSLDEGWLKVQWKPFGFFIFPGRFSEEKWRQVLRAMHTVAVSLEAVGNTHR